jgi:hypothetical protein
VLAQAASLRVLNHRLHPSEGLQQLATPQQLQQVAAAVLQVLQRRLGQVAAREACQIRI